MFKKIFSLTVPAMIFSVSICSVASAGTVIKIQDGNEMTTMLTDGKWARINMSAGEYALVDYASHKISMVNPSKKQVMVFDAKSGGSQSGKKSSLVNLSLRNRGKPRNVAGYHSDRYEYFANGKSCGVVYASKSALNENGVKQLLYSMRALIDQQRALMGGFAAMIDDCKLADMELTDKVGSIGVPMMKEDNGRVSTRVKSIDVDVDLPADVFQLPAGYAETTAGELVQQADKSLSGNQISSQPLPQPTPAYSKRQQPGQFSPEIMDQIRRSQGMMRHYQQR